MSPPGEVQMQSEAADDASPVEEKPGKQQRSVEMQRFFSEKTLQDMILMQFVAVLYMR